MADEYKTVSELWCVNIVGPNDVLAAASRAEAVELAAKFNDTSVSRFEIVADENTPLMWAVPMVWPHGASSHADNLGDLGEYQWIRSQPAPAALASVVMLAALRDIEKAGLGGYLTPELCADLVVDAIKAVEGRK